MSEGKLKTMAATTFPDSLVDRRVVFHQNTDPDALRIIFHGHIPPLDDPFEVIADSHAQPHQEGTARTLTIKPIGSEEEFTAGAVYLDVIGSNPA